MTRFLLTLLTLGAIALACWAMWRGWVHRGERQAGLPAPAEPPADFSADLLEGCPGRYLASTTAGQWLDRIVAHGLGTPSRAVVRVGRAGVVIEREGARSFFVPAADVEAVRVDKGIAGAVFETGGVVVLTWRLGTTSLDSGLRAQHTDDHVAIAAAVHALPGAPGPGAGSTAPAEGGTR